jgi:hypothetical protein
MKAWLISDTTRRRPSAYDVRDMSRKLLRRLHKAGPLCATPACIAGDMGFDYRPLRSARVA